MADQRERRTRRKKKTTSAEAALAAARKRRRDEERKQAAARTAKPGTKVDQPAAKPAVTPPAGFTPRDEAGRQLAQKVSDKKFDKRQGEPISGISMLQAADRVDANAQALAAEQKPRSLADPGLFGGVSDASIKARLTAQKNATDEIRRARLRKEGSAIYMGAKEAAVRRALPGDSEFEGGQYRVPKSVQIDNVVDKNQLMAWLADENRFNDIKGRMQKAGLDVESYDDVAKLWKSVLDQAGATYSLTGKKVTPWSLLELRGKQMVGGKPQSKTTISTSIEEMDPSQARLMFEKAAQEFLGRRASNDEIDDFIAKAQTIARQNPQVTKTTTQFGFDGEAVSQASVSSGGADATAAAAQLAAQDMAMQDEEYGALQASGYYMPMLLDALGSPTD